MKGKHFLFALLCFFFNIFCVDGDIVTVVDHKGAFLARGYWNHLSQIQVRILTWQDEPIDEAWWRKMLKQAIDSRAQTYYDADEDVPTTPLSGVV